MIRDIATELSSAQAAATGTVVSTNYLDTQHVRGDPAVGENVDFVFTVDEDFAGGTSVDFQLFTSAASTFSPEVSIFASGAIPIADLVKGKQIAVKLPYGTQRYLRAKYVVVGNNTDGAITAGIVKDSPHWHAPAVGVEY